MTAAVSALYADWLNCPEGRQESGERYRLWQEHYQVVQQQGSDLSVQRPDVIAQMYVSYRRQWESRQLGQPSQYRLTSRWDSVWRDVALFCERNSVNPELLMRAVFNRPGAPDVRLVQPNSLLSASLQQSVLQGGVRSELQHELQAAVQAKCLYALQDVRRHMEWLADFSTRGLSQTEALQISLLRHTNSAYALPAYCLGATQGLWAVCAQLRVPGFQQWLGSPREYCTVLNELNPPEWQFMGAPHG